MIIISIINSYYNQTQDPEARHISTARPGESSVHILTATAWRIMIDAVG